MAYSVHHRPFDPNTATLIGICGHKGSGKTYVASLLERKYAYQRQSLSTPLKDMLLAVGLTDEQVHGKLKDTPCDFLRGLTPRHAMQTLGTEWGRDLMWPEFWLDMWRHRMASASLPVVVDDVRFVNEAEAIRGMGGQIWHISRSGLVVAQRHDAHESEQGIPSSYVDLVVYNRGSLMDLNEAVTKLMGKRLCAIGEGN